MRSYHPVWDTQSSLFIHHPLYHAIVWHLMPFYVRGRKIYSRERLSYILFVYWWSAHVYFSHCWIFSILPPLYSFHFIYFSVYFAKYFRYSCRHTKKSFSFNEMFLFYDDYDIQPLIPTHCQKYKNVLTVRSHDSSDFCSFERQILISSLFCCSFVIFTTFEYCMMFDLVKYMAHINHNVASQEKI